MASPSVAAYFLSLIVFYIWSAKSQSQFTANQQPPKVSFRESSLGSDELKLVDVVLLASVDGRFHALKRTTGRMIWSMDVPIADTQVAVTRLKELVSTEHGNLLKTNDVSLDDFVDDPASTETYIIEPQSGTIFVSPADSTREDPLQRLPFTMQQLDENLLEELDSSGADRTLVQIRRTEYHISVYVHGQVIQNLTYASYGPNTTEKEVQYDWRNTPDNLYHLPTPDGKLLVFKTDEKEPFHSFIDRLKRPIVAVFDAVDIPNRSGPLLLAQPKPALSDLYPSRIKELRELSKRDDITWVGRIGNSLYALSRNTFPLVIFSQMPRLHDDSGDVDEKLKGIMKNWYGALYNASKECAAENRPEGTLPSLVMDASDAGLIKVVEVMKAQSA
ncbi:bifunctional endoribonuclease/protein kinase ire1 [Tulasnella sp. UAMH 9824]|nr:bifunctional endoribonuclease/protein kinase ire1 [Tulasnella sp. UAMH 9824]